MTALLVDDEPSAISGLRQKIVALGLNITIVGEAMDATEGLAKIERLRPELVFLDIEMPGNNGFDLIRKLKADNRPEVIFVTSEDRYAMQAIRVSALFYILKPVKDEELRAAVKLARERIKQKESSKRLDALLANLESKEDDKKKVGIPSEKGVEYINAGEILHCEGESGYTYIYLKDGSHRYSSYSVGEYRKMLEPYGFISIHRSVIINTAQVVEHERSGRIVLSDGKAFTVARRKREMVAKLLAKAKNRI